MASLHALADCSQQSPCAVSLSLLVQCVFDIWLRLRNLLPDLASASAQNNTLSKHRPKIFGFGLLQMVELDVTIIIHEFMNALLCSMTGPEDRCVSVWSRIACLLGTTRARRAMTVTPSGCSLKVWLYQTLNSKTLWHIYEHCSGGLFLPSFICQVFYAQLLRCRHVAVVCYLVHAGGHSEEAPALQNSMSSSQLSWTCETKKRGKVRAFQWSQCEPPKATAQS